MKKLTLILGLFLAVAAHSQQESIKICFKREKQAEKQMQRLNRVKEYYDGYNIIKCRYRINDTCYYLNIVANDAFLTYGVFNRFVIKRRHLNEKHIINPDPVGFGYDVERLVYDKKKLKK